jgi:hypothetical protein
MHDVSQYLAKIASSFELRFHARNALVEFLKRVGIVATIHHEIVGPPWDPEMASQEDPRSKEHRDVCGG